MVRVTYYKNNKIIEPVPDCEVFKELRVNRPEDAYAVTPLCWKNPNKVFKLIKDHR